MNDSVKKQLSKSDIKDLNKKLNELYGIEPFTKKDLVELHDKKYIIKDKQLLYFYHDGTLYPSLQLLQNTQVMKAIVVDMGAIRFVANGADVMRPGITEIADDITKGQGVVIVDETHKKPLAVGIAMYDSAEMREQETGKSIKSIHYVGDDIWNYAA